MDGPSFRDVPPGAQVTGIFVRFSPGLKREREKMPAGFVNL